MGGVTETGVCGGGRQLGIHSVRQHNSQGERMTVLRRRLSCNVLLMLGVASALGAQKRPMTPDDLFRIAEIGSVSWSPDGRFVAVGISSGLEVLDGSVRNTRIWILDPRSRALRPLQVPDTSLAAAWHPVWSPDGSKLAFLVADRQAVITPWVWQVRDPQPRRIHGIDVQINFGDPPMAWLDSTRLLFLAWARGAQKHGDLFMSIWRGHYAPELWSRARQGREASVTTLESGGKAVDAAEAEVILVDLAKGSKRTLTRGKVHRVTASPDGHRLAYFVENPGMPAQRASSFFEHRDLYDAVNWGSQLHVFDMRSNEEAVTPVDVVSAGYQSLEWSAEGRLLLPGQLRGVATGVGLLVSSDRRMERLEIPQLAAIDPSSARWLKGNVLVRGKALAADRWDWWLVSSGVPQNLTRSQDSIPSTLIPGPNGTLLGAAAGDIWQISPTSDVVNLTRSLAPQITGLRTLSADGGILIGTVDGQDAMIRIVDEAVSFAQIEPPRAGARLRAFSPLGDAFVAAGDFSDGTFLWIAGGGGRSVSEAAVAWHGNRWIEEIVTGKEEYFRYSGLDGQEYGGWLLTPPANTAARDLPLIVDIYPGFVHDQGTSPFAILSSSSLNPHLFAAHGYAVLLPSVPDINSFRGAERLRALTIGILPAVDSLIARHIVDPDRLAIVGQSAGGYATLGVIAQTTRFRAAIASASYSNLISLYGTFYGQHRYGDGGDPQAGQVLRMLQLERGYASMGGPPWEKLDDYIGASPLFHTFKVQTPVMLVHGDFDFIPIQQAEEYFTALYRQDKRVQFLRYHGEEHMPSTRGNVLDLWERIDAWLTELLGR